MTDTPERRVVKRYAGDRLYDTAVPGYTTAELLRGLQSKGGDVVVIDAQTGKNVTQAVLAS